jgi:hypothetical protein
MFPTFLMFFIETIGYWKLLWELGRAWEEKSQIYDVLYIWISSRIYILKYCPFRPQQFICCRSSFPFLVHLMSLCSSKLLFTRLIYLPCQFGDTCLPVDLSCSGSLFKFPMYFCIVILYNWAFYRIPLSWFLNVCSDSHVVAVFNYNYSKSRLK